MFQESFSPLDQPTSGGLALSTVAAQNLREAGKWGRFIAIVYFIFMGIGLLATLFAGSASIMVLANLGGVFSLVYLFLMILFIGLGIYLTYKLYSFSTNAIKAADLNDANALSLSMDALRFVFKFTGILMIILLGFYALGIIAFIFADLAGSSL